MSIYEDEAQILADGWKQLWDSEINQCELTDYEMANLLIEGTVVGENFDPQNPDKQDCEGSNWFYAEDESLKMSFLIFRGNFIHIVYMRP